MRKIMKIAKKNKIDVIEDACMGIGGKIFNKSPGTFGKINAFSMHPLKSLNVMGDGGVVSTNNKNIAKWIQKYRNHGMIDRDHIDFWGVNIRMQPLQAIVAIEGLKKINQIIKIRNRNATRTTRGGGRRSALGGRFGLRCFRRRETRARADRGFEIESEIDHTRRSQKKYRKRTRETNVKCSQPSTL